MTVKDSKAEKKVLRINNKSLDALDLYNSKTPEPLELAFPIDKEPRYYQINGVLKLNHYLSEGFKRILYIMPTGTGKTLQSKLSVMSNIVQKTMGWDKKEKIRVLFIVHKNRLLRQAANEYANCGNIELITQSAFQDVPQSVIDEGWDVTFIDEAHHEAMMSIQMLLDQLGNIPIIGFTANPNRGDNLLVKFEKFIMPISKKQAIEEGFISNPAINSIMDTGKVDKTDLAISLVKKYRYHMGNTIAFFKTNKECERFYNFCCQEGIAATWLTPTSSEKALDKALDDLSKCKIQFLINCKRVDEGIDVLNCTDVLLARNFKIHSEKEQLAGRAIRPDTPCTIWEFTNPYIDSIEADQVVGAYRSRRFLYIKNNEWHDTLLEGSDPTWGYAEKLRFTYLKDAEINDPVLIDIKNKLKHSQQKLIQLDKNIKVKQSDVSNDTPVFAKEDKVKSVKTDDNKPTDLEKPTETKVEATKLNVSEPIKKPTTSNKLVINRKLIFDLVDPHLKAKVRTMSKDELIQTAKELRVAGKI